MTAIVSVQSTVVSHAPPIGGALALLAIILIPVVLSYCLAVRNTARTRERFASKVAANNAAYLASVSTRAAEAADFEMAVALAADEKREDEMRRAAQFRADVRAALEAEKVEKDVAFARELNASLTKIAKDVAKSEARAKRFAFEMGRYLEAKEAEKKAAMDAAMCRLFDEYKHNFWNGQFADKHAKLINCATIGCPISGPHVMTMNSNTFPEQSQYATAVYDALPYNRVDITLSEDKINITRSLLAQLCRIDRNLTVKESCAKEDVMGSLKMGSVSCDAGYMHHYHNGTGTSFTIVGKYSNVLSATPILHGGKIYIEITFGYLGKKYIDPSVCNQYSANFMIRPRALPDAFVELPPL